MALYTVEGLEQRRLALIERVAKLTDEQRQHRPAKGAFNALEVLEHMALAEAYYPPMLDQTKRKGLNERDAKPNMFFRWAVNGMRRARPMPTIAPMTPKVTPTFDAAKAAWDEARSRLVTYLNAVPNGKTAVKHPFFGKLGPEHVLELLDAHTEYHEKRFPVATEA